MIIECPNCESKVHAKVLAERDYPPDDNVDPHKYVFLECPSCHRVLLGYSEFALGGYDEGNWTNPIRLWPHPYLSVDANVPSLVRNSLEAAQKCYQAKVYDASAVMCGRALEAICVEKIGEKTLHKGLQKLRETNVIDDRLYNWGEALRKERNIGAHATKETVSKLDAKDILDFAMAIVDYIYVLTVKFEAYQARKSKGT